MSVSSFARRVLFPVLCAPASVLRNTRLGPSEHWTAYGLCRCFPIMYVSMSGTRTAHENTSTKHFLPSIDSSSNMLTFEPDRCRFSCA
eukprot:3402284-Rhodomonas_salina.2